jgi:hypothetical protein
MGMHKIHDSENPSHNAEEYSRIMASPTTIYNMALKTKDCDIVDSSDDYTFQNARETYANLAGFLRLPTTTKMETQIIEDSKREGWELFNSDR